MSKWCLKNKILLHCLFVEDPIWLRNIHYFFSRNRIIHLKLWKNDVLLFVRFDWIGSNNYTFKVPWHNIVLIRFQSSLNICKFLHAICLTTIESITRINVRHIFNCSPTKKPQWVYCDSYCRIALFVYSERENFHTSNIFFNWR